MQRHGHCITATDLAYGVLVYYLPTDMHTSGSHGLVVTPVLSPDYGMGLPLVARCPPSVCLFWFCCLKKPPTAHSPWPR